MKRIGYRLLFLFTLLLALSACGSRQYPAEPPDLTGDWVQSSRASNFYQVAKITDKRVYLYWHLVDDGSEYLYWDGTFVPPENGKEPYTWVSENRLKYPQWHPWARREEVLDFTYKDGKISYIEIQGRLRLTVSLVRAEEAAETEAPE